MRTPDKFRKIISKTYRSTPEYRLDRLIGEESRWARRETIARNKLADVRVAINRMAKECVEKTAAVKEAINE